MRDIPSTVPDEIADLIYRNWGDIKRFSEACGLKYTAVHSVLCRSNHGVLDKLCKLAGALTISTEALVDLIDKSDKDTFLKYVQDSGLTCNDLADKVGISRSYIHALFNGNIKHAQLKTLCGVSSRLGLSLERFREVYKLAKAS